MEKLKKYINEIYDFPKEGIVFKDINPIYREPTIWNQLMQPIQNLILTKKPDFIAGIESRGFISASALAFKLKVGFIPIRKPNKLPDKVIGVNYMLEYGDDRLEIQQNTFKKDSKIMVMDDLLATGGTASAAGKLIKQAGGDLIGYAFLIELTDLKGRNKLDSNIFVESVVKY